MKFILTALIFSTALIASNKIIMITTCKMSMESTNKKTSSKYMRIQFTLINNKPIKGFVEIEDGVSVHIQPNGRSKDGKWGLSTKPYKNEIIWYLTSSINGWWNAGFNCTSEKIAIQ